MSQTMPNTHREEQATSLLAKNFTTAELDLIRGTSKPPPVVTLRLRAFRLLRDAGFSLPEIGFMCNKHHTTVLLALRRNDG